MVYVASETLAVADTTPAPTPRPTAWVAETVNALPLGSSAALSSTSSSASSVPTDTNIAPIITPPDSSSAASTTVIALLSAAVVCVALIFAIPVIRRKWSTSSKDEISIGSEQQEPQPGLRSISVETSDFIAPVMIGTAVVVAAESNPRSSINLETKPVFTSSPSTANTRRASATGSIGRTVTTSVAASLPFPVDESDPCSLHPFATEKHTLGACTTYKRLVAQKRFDDLERAFIESEKSVRRAEASALGFQFPVNIDGPCALHPSSTGDHAHILADCRKYKTLVQQKRFGELEKAFLEAASVVEAVAPFTGNSSALAFPYIMNEEAPCAVHPTTTKKHTLGQCHTYQRLVQTNKFDELEELLNKAALKVEAVKRVTFAATPSPAPPSATPLPKISANNNPSVYSEDSKSASVTVHTHQSKASSMLSGDGYDPSFDGSTSTGLPVSGQRTRRLSGLQKAGVWWKNVSAGSRPPQRPPVGTSRNRLTRESPVPSSSHRSIHSENSTSSAAARGNKSLVSETEDGFVTAPEYISESENGYHTATSKFTASDQEYFTATEN
ncbi:UNVERIFIED_CONTAM: hypothetical protein HDU68_011200 [Siphonaria sp. JEL0065]|nr:hypothetical protein HDU68_011200 [Siphonaria sp. JEL0065]